MAEPATYSMPAQRARPRLSPIDIYVDDGSSYESKTRSLVRWGRGESNPSHLGGLGASGRVHMCRMWPAADGEEKAPARGAGRGAPGKLSTCLSKGRGERRRAPQAKASPAGARVPVRPATGYWSSVDNLFVVCLVRGGGGTLLGNDWRRSAKSVRFLGLCLRSGLPYRL